jgi:hypothetical protein
VAVRLTQWRYSTEVYADPVLLEILARQPEGDLGPVLPPSGDSCVLAAVIRDR